MERRLTPAGLNERYKKAAHFTMGCVFDGGNTRFGPELSDEIKSTNAGPRRQVKLLTRQRRNCGSYIVAEVGKIKEETDEPLFSLGVKLLEKLAPWKTQKGGIICPPQKISTFSKGGTRDQMARVIPHHPV